MTASVTQRLDQVKLSFTRRWKAKIDDNVLVCVCVHGRHSRLALANIKWAVFNQFYKYPVKILLWCKVRVIHSTYSHLLERVDQTIKRCTSTMTQVNLIPGQGRVFVSHFFPVPHCALLQGLHLTPQPLSFCFVPLRLQAPLWLPSGQLLLTFSRSVSEEMSFLDTRSVPQPTSNNLACNYTKHSEEIPHLVVWQVIYRRFTSHNVPL